MADRERQRLIFAHQKWLDFVQPVGPRRLAPGHGGEDRTAMKFNQPLPGILSLGCGIRGEPVCQVEGSGALAPDPYPQAAARRRNGLTLF